MALPKIDLPEFSTTIPSTGDMVNFRPYTNGEEKLLLTALESNDVADIIKTTKNTILNCFTDLDVNTLTSYDIDYLFLQLRIQSVSDKSDLYFRSKVCGKTGVECEKTTKVTIDLSKITVQQYDDSIDEYTEYVPENRKNGGTIIKTSSTTGITIKHPGFIEQEKFSKLPSKNQTSDELIKICIVNIYDEETVYTREDFSDEELSDYYAGLVPKNLDALKEFMQNIPKVRYKVDFKCKECGFTEPLIFEDLESFFA